MSSDYNSWGIWGRCKPPQGSPGAQPLDYFWILDLLDAWKLHSKCDYFLEIRNPYGEKNGGPLMAVSGRMFLMEKN